MTTSATDGHPTGSVDGVINENQIAVDAGQDHQPGVAGHPPEADAPAPGRSSSDDQPIASSAGTYPRIVQEHHLVGPHGEDEIEAIDDRGRRWYHLRPERPGRADLMGFNYTWWLVAILLVVAVFPWPGWGY
jgi:hypothetical protein